MDIAMSIEHLLPAAQYGGSTNQNTQAAYNTLKWNDPRPKPTWAQIQAAYQAIKESLRERRRKTFAALKTEVQALSPADQNKLQMGVMVEFLAEHPQFAKNKLGINIEGDEPE